MSWKGWGLRVSEAVRPHPPCHNATDERRPAEGAGVSSPGFVGTTLATRSETMFAPGVRLPLPFPFRSGRPKSFQVTALLLAARALLPLVALLGASVLLDL